MATTNDTETTGGGAPAAVPPPVRAFVQRHRIPSASIRPDGRVVLSIDQHYRVQLIPAPHNRVAIQHELLALPDQESRAFDDLLLRLAKAACGLLQQHASTLSIDRRRQALVLQQTVEASADLAALEGALADFTNTLPFWGHLCRAEAVNPQRMPS